MKILRSLSTALFVGLLVVACAGTKLAYERAETLDAKAYVVTEHYAAILREANELADRGAPRELVVRMQAADRVASPLVLQLRTAAETYNAAKTAENAAALQVALDAAAVQVAAFIRALRGQ